MIADNKKISTRQIGWILCLDMIAIGLFGMSEQLSDIGNANFVCAAILALIIVDSIYFAIFNWRYQFKTSQGLLGRNIRFLKYQKMKWIGKVLAMVYYLIALIWTLKYFLKIVHALIPTQYMYPLFFFMIPIVYGAYKGIEVRGRMAELIGWLVVIPFIALFIAALWQRFSGVNEWLIHHEKIDIYPIRHFLDWFSNFKFLEVIKGVGRVLPIFLVLDNPIVLSRQQGLYDKSKNWLVGFIGGSIMILFGLILVALYFTPQGMANESHPFGILLQMVRLPGNFISRYDIFFIMLWSMSFYMLVSGLFVNLLEVIMTFFSSSFQMRMRFKKSMSILVILVCILPFLVGCQTVAEPQNRNYMMTIGVDALEDGFQFEYSFPDLAVLTGTNANENEPVQTVQAKNLRDATQKLNAMSDKISDYSQLSVIIIGEKIYNHKQKLSEVMQLFKNENAIKRTVMIAFAKDKAEDIMKLDDDVNGSIAVFLYELCQNNYESQGYQVSVLEDFLGGMTKENTQVPIFDEEENRPVLVKFMSMGGFD